MADLSSSQSQKKLSGLCYENTVIDRKGRIRKIKPPVASKPRTSTQPPYTRGDSFGERREAQHPNGSLNTEPSLNTRNILEVNANETTKFQPDTKHTKEPLDNDTNRFECYEPVWKERLGAKHASNPEHCRQGVVTTGHYDTRETPPRQDITGDKEEVVTVGQDITRNTKEIIKTTGQEPIRDKQGLVMTGQDIIRDVDSYKEVLLKSAQLRFRVQKIQKQRIDRIEDGVVAAAAAAAAANRNSPQKEEEPIRDIYEFALENLDEDDDDDDDDEEDDDEEDEDGCGRSLRSESPDTLVERILENIDDDGITVDFDGDKVPEKPPRKKKLYSKEKSFSDEILERLGETPKKSPDVAPTSRSYYTNERIRSSTKRSGVYDTRTARVQTSEQQKAERVRQHSELSSAAAAAVIRLDRYIIDQQPITDAEPQIHCVEPKITEAKPNGSHAESNSAPRALSLVTMAALSPDVTIQPTIVNAPALSNLSHDAVQPSVTMIQSTESRLVRERSPEDVFEEIVEAMRDTEGEYEDPFFLDWPAFFPPGKSPKGGLRTDRIPIDYSVENDWLSFFYCNRVNVADETTGVAASQRRSSLQNLAQAFPNSAAEGVSVFLNTSLSSSSSWISRPVRGTFPHTSLSKEPTTTRSEERCFASPATKQPEEVALKSTEPVDVVSQSRARPSPMSSRSDEQTDLAFQSNSGPSKSMPQNPPDLLPSPASDLRALDDQYSKDDHLDFVRADQTIRTQNFPEVEPQTVDVPQSVVHTVAYQNLDDNSQRQQATGEKIQDLEDTEAKPLPLDNSERVSSTATEISSELSAEPKPFPSENPEEPSVIDDPQIDSKANGNPTAVLFAALDAAFARHTSRPEAESLKENDVASDGDIDKTLTPKDDISQGVWLQSHHDTFLNKHLFSPEPSGTVDYASRPENREHEAGNMSGPRLQQSGALHLSLEESKPQESQMEKTPSKVEAETEEDKLLTAHGIIDPSHMTEHGAIPNRFDEDTSRTRVESSAEIGVDISKIPNVSESEKIVITESTSNDEKVAETDFQPTIANCDSIDAVTVHQPRPPKRVVKVLSDEVTTQTVLLKIAWPAAKGRERSRERIEQPFRELQLRRTIRMTDPGNNVSQTGRQIPPSAPLPSTKNHSHITSASGEQLNYGNDVVNSSGIPNNSNDVVTSNEAQSNARADSQPPAPSSIATKPEFLVEYENEERSHNTEVTQDSTVDVTQTDSVKVLLVPMETVYKVQDLKEIVAAVGKTILNESRRIPVESNIRVTCEAVQSKSCAAVQDRDVTIIRNTILDTYNSANALTVKASTD